MNVVELPPSGVVSVPQGLRNLADSIEAGDFNDAHMLAYVIDCGGGLIEVGLLGRAVEPALMAHYLLACGQRKLESVVV